MIDCFYKRSHKFLAVLLFFFFSALTHVALAQDVDCSLSANCSNAYCNYAANIEKGCNCFDNIDNDGDGKVDKADTNCAQYYGLTFVGGDEGSCPYEVPNTDADPFNLINAPITSSQNTADTQSKVSVGDVDGDGIPDAVITSKWGSEIRVVATASGQPDGTKPGDVKSDFNLSGNEANKLFDGTPSSGACKVDNGDRMLFEHENLIADINGDGKAELFGIVSNRNNSAKAPPACFYLVAFTYASSTLVPLYNAVSIGTDRPGTFGIADMDGDGKAELYIRDRIYAAETGKLLASAGGNWDSDITSAPTAANISGDDKLELICGTKIYSIPSLTNRTPASAASLTLLHDMNTITTNKCYVKLMNDPIEYGVDTHSSCSIGDVDGDGNIDVIISGALNSTSGKTAVFYWNVAKNKVSYYLPLDPNNTNGWPWGTGRVNLIDTDHDGLLDMYFIAGNQLYRLETTTGGETFPTSINTTQDSVSQKTINDSRSGVLTVTVYDFDNDGDYELVYRDSKQLAAVDADTLSITYWTAVCESHTYTEGPIIADVNGDGGTDICVTCNTSNSFDITDDIQQQALGQFRLYYSSANDWLPTRQVWNQPGYFVVNVNDDLTLPYPQISQLLEFGDSDTECNGQTGVRQPFNVFLNQVPFLNDEGCPVYPAPDLSFYGDDPDLGVDTDGDGVYTPAIEVIPPICGDLAVQVRFNIVNHGDLPITATVPVSFFNGDPRVAGAATLLFTANLNIVALAVDATYTSQWFTINGNGSTFPLHIALNNNGSVLPIASTGGLTNECKIDDNFYDITVTPDPFTTKISKTDNTSCNDAAGNGTVTVKVFKGTTEVTDYSPYSVQWYSGTAASYTPIAGQTGFTMTNLQAGDYTVIVTNTAKGCSSVPIDTIVIRTQRQPKVTLTYQDATKCSPADGSITATVEGGNVGMTFVWRENGGSALPITTSTATNLTGNIEYQLIVTNGSCSTDITQFIDGPDRPDANAITVQNVEDCTNPNSGKIRAIKTDGTIVSDSSNYTFSWYYYNSGTATRGSILPVSYGTGPTRYGLPAGSYELVVTDNTTQCISLQSPEVTVSTSTVLPSVSISQVAAQTSCDPANPNGVLTAVATATGLTSPNDFTFEWFKGDNTLPANKVTTTSGTKGETLNQVAGGGIVYTVKATTALNCSATNKLVIEENINVPIITLTPSPNSVCNATLPGASTYTGKVTASVTFNGSTITLPNALYTFKWYNGSNTAASELTPANNDYTNPVYSGLNGGNYTATVTRTDLACTSTPDTKLVLNTPVYPAIKTDSVGSTNCTGGTKDGSVTVTSVSPDNTRTYQWFDHNNADTGQTGTTLSGLQGGTSYNYTVKVTYTETGCFSTKSTNVPDIKALPIITLTSTENSICSPATNYNGTASQATLTDVKAITGDTYTYKWANGTDMTTSPRTETTSSISTLNGGFYSATVTNDRSKCTSNPVTVEVKNNQTLPAISSVPTPSKNCSGGTADGSIAITITNALAGVTYNYGWYNGISAATASRIDTLNNQTSTNTKSGLQGGTTSNYTVKVKNNTTGCTNTFTQLLADASVAPVLTLSQVENSICASSVDYNGKGIATLSAYANDPAGPYIYKWYSGNSTAGTLLRTNEGTLTKDTLTQRNGGFYTATITSKTLNCTSNPVTVQVLNNITLPAISTTPTASTNCTGGTANGSILASVTNHVGSDKYDYVWYSGASAVLASRIDSVGNQSVTTNTKTGLQGGVTNSYTIKVRNKSTGCTNTFTQALADASVAPVLTLTQSENSICDSSVGYNGKGIATLSPYANDATGPYIYVWYQGNGTAGTKLQKDSVTVSTSTLNNVNGGFYTATVRSKTLNCTSNPVTVQVLNNITLPAISTTPTASTNCTGGTANGSILASVTNHVGSDKYDYVWYSGASAVLASRIDSVGNQSVTTNTKTGLQGGVTNSYTIKVRNKSTGCTNTFTQALADASVAPVLTLTQSDNSICDSSVGYNGKGIATLSPYANDATGPYIYVWYQGNGTAGTKLQKDSVTVSTSTLNNVNGGFYTATVRSKTLNCTSNPVTVQVLNNITLPAISTTPTASTNCTGGTANGSILASVTNHVGSDKYDYLWYTGTSAVFASRIDSIGNQSVTTNTKTGLQGGATNNYTIKVRNKSTGCTNTFTQLLPDNSTPPVLTLSQEDNSICDENLGYNGKAKATLSTYTNDTDGPFIYKWYEGNSIVGTLLRTSPEVTALKDSVTNRNGGFYTAIVTSKDLNCTSNPVTVQVINTLDYPDLSTTAEPSTNCLPDGAANGKVVANIATPGTDSYEYVWYTGTTNEFVNQLDSIASQGATNTLADIQGGVNTFYTVKSTNERTGCFTVVTQALVSNSSLPTFTLTPTDNGYCSAPYNGSVTITGFTDNNSKPDHTYTITWSGNGVGGTTVQDELSFAEVSAGDTTELDARIYYAVIKNDTLGCASNSVNVEVVDNLVLPQFTLTPKDATNCAGGVDNGSVIGEVTNAVAFDTFTFNWYLGNTVGIAPIDTKNNVALKDTTENLAGNLFYTLEIKNDSSRCTNTKTVFVNNDSELPVLSALQKEDNINCTGNPTGKAFVNDVKAFSYRSVDYPDDNTFTGFTFSWTGLAGTETVSLTGDSISVVAPGVYTLTVKQNADNCISNPVSVTIVDDFTFPTLSAEVLDKQTSCDATASNGQLQASTTAPGHNFQWYEGLGTGSILNAGKLLNDSTSLQVLSSGDYTVTAKNTTTGCESLVSITLPDSIVYPTLVMNAATNVTACASPNGAISVDQTLTTVRGFNDGDFRIYYLKQDPTAVISDPSVIKASATLSSALASGLTYSNLAPADYTVIIRDSVTHCQSNPVTIAVLDMTDPADISINFITKATACNGGNDGGIDVDVSGGAGGYTYSWYTGGPLNNPPFDYFPGGYPEPDFGGQTSFDPENDDVVAGQPAGLYTVLVKDNLGCGSFLTIGIPFQDAPRFALEGINSTKCDLLAGNGQIDLSLVGNSEYTIRFYSGLDPSIAVPLASAPDITLKLNGLDDDGDGLTDGADADFDAGGDPASNTIDDDGDLLIDDADPDFDTNGVGGNGTDSDGDGLIDENDINLEGSLTDIVNKSVTNLNPGGYLIEVEDDAIFTATGVHCKMYKTIIIDVDAVAPVITLGSIVPNTACDTANYASGIVNLTVSQHPADATTTIKDYKLTSITALIPTPATTGGLALWNTVDADLDAGATQLFKDIYPVGFASRDGGFGPQTYKLEITENTTGCVSEQFVTIPDQPEIPQVINVDLAPETYCVADPMTNNGTGYAEVTTVEPVAIDDYNYEWSSTSTFGAGDIVYNASGATGGEKLDASKVGASWWNATVGLGTGTQEYYVRGQRIEGTGPGAGCYTPVVKVTIEDNHVAPAPLYTILPNTSCDPFVGEGRVSVEIEDTNFAAGLGTDYSYTITSPVALAGTNASPINGSGVVQIFTGLDDDTYTIETANVTSGCISTSDISILSKLFVLEITDIDSVNQLICNNYGQIDVKEIKIDRSLTAESTLAFNTPLSTDFTFKWFRANSATPGTFDPASELKDTQAIPATIAVESLISGTAATQYDDMNAGTFYVIATKTTTIGKDCPTIPYRVDLKDLHENPIITLTPYTNTSCSTDPLEAEGQIDVLIQENSLAPFDAPGNVFDYTWTSASSTPIGNLTMSGMAQVYNNLKHGNYSVVVKNNDTGCETTAATTIVQATTPVFVTQSEVYPQRYCKNSGNIEITQISYEDRTGTTTVIAPTDLEMLDFEFYWSKNGTTVGNNGLVLDSTIYAAISSGTYQVYAKRIANEPGKDCESAPLTLNIGDDIRYPAITLTPFSNTSCSGSYEGSIEVDIKDDSQAEPTPFVFDLHWSSIAGSNIPDSLNASGVDNIFNKLKEGDYKLTATDTVTGCSSDATTFIIKNETPIFVTEVDLFDQYLCLNSGHAEVKSISYNMRDGSTVTGDTLLTKFQYQWTNSAATTVLNYNNSTVMDSLNYPAIVADTYYVVAKRVSGFPGNGCESSPFRIDIEDKSINPVITLTPFSNTACNNDFEGEIEVDVSDNSKVSKPFNYDYGWTAVTPLTLALPTVNNTAQNGSNNLYPATADPLKGLQDGEYKITVTNNVTGCVDSATTIIIKNQTPVFVTTVDMEPQYICNPDGSAEVIAISYKDRSGLTITGDSLLTRFQYKWFKNDVSTQIRPYNDSTALDVVHYPSIGYGTYYVVAQRTTGFPGAGCESAPIRVDITDERNFPQITLTPFSNTACNADYEGEIEVDVNDISNAPKPFNYDYKWAAVNPLTLALPTVNNTAQNGSNNLFPATTDPLKGLQDGEYKLIVTNNVTGCVDSTTTTIIKNQTPVFVTTVDMLPQYICNPDGSAEVTSISYKDRSGATITGDSLLTRFQYKWYKTDVSNLIRPYNDSTALDVVHYPSIGYGTYYVVAQRTTGFPGAGCESAPVRVDITDKRNFPVITLTPFSNTSCSDDQSEGEGEIEIDVSDASNATGPFNYNYVWTSVNPTTLSLPTVNNTAQDGTDNLYPAATDPLQGLQDGEYKVTVTNNVTGCVSSANTTIIKNSIPVFVQTSKTIPQFYCTPSGQVEITGVTYKDRTGASFPGALADFSFKWFADDQTTVIADRTSAMPRWNYLDSTTYAGPATMGAGTYYVVTTRTAGGPGLDCESAPYRVDVGDKRDYPVVGFTTVANTACDNNFDGRITVLSSTKAGTVGAASNYDIDFTAPSLTSTVTDVTNVGASYTTPVTDVVGPGEYNVTVTNRITGCPMDGKVTMISNPPSLEIVTVTKTDQMICNPDGSITVNAIAPATVANYTFRYYSEDVATTALTDKVSGTTITSSTLTTTNYNVVAGRYYVVGIRNANSDPGSGCPTPPFEVEILDLHQNPALTFEPIANSACKDELANGSVTVDANENDGTQDTYTFIWEFNGVTPASTSTDTTSTVSSALNGTYYVTVKNTLTGCPTKESVEIIVDRTRSTPNIIEVLPTHPTNCFGSGSAIVTEITLGSTSNSTTQPPKKAPDNTVKGADLDNFIFEWYKDEPIPTNQLPIGGPFTTSKNITNLYPGTIYVKVKDPSTACVSSPKEVIIDDLNIVYPILEIRQDSLQIGCMPIGTATLTATADIGLPRNSRNDYANYEFFWYDGLEAGIGTSKNIASDSTLDNQFAGEYSVRVKDTQTNCTSDAFYIVPDQSEQFTPVVSLSTDPRYNCVNPDGVLFAREIGTSQKPGYPFGGAKLRYEAEWYVGSGVDTSVPGTPMPVLSPISWEVDGLDVGVYTVRIKDMNTDCYSDAEVTINDARVPPTVDIHLDNPLINCDPAIANGQLSATADGGLIGGYSFEWYEGAMASGTILSDQNILIGRGMGTYTVRATNDLTLCFADKQGDITDGRLYPPVPTVAVIQDRASCVSPDGWLSASVDGVTYNYTFDWYNGTTADGSADYTGTDYQNLDFGQYAVTAMDQVTGCISQPAVEEIKDVRVYPNMFFKTTPSYCKDVNPAGEGNGTAELQLDPADIVADDIQWYEGLPANASDPNSGPEAGASYAGSGSYITEQLPGIYSAYVTTSFGCKGNGSTEIKTEILTYNLVTTNGDDTNDKFQIDCISLFPNNNVKIYNRSGILVYEADGYNNNEVVFKGRGEKGVYTTGNLLPVGTYFYIIDKRDGTKPRVGYLELAR